jgi:hypothetical protein
MKKWYEDSKHQGVMQLCTMFNVQQAEYFALANKFRNTTSRATKKNHEHVVRPCGSKALKKYNRFAWDKKYV